MMSVRRERDRYDCIVVGAGNGGLVAAATLAASGARVLVLEQHNLPGGFASSFVRGRFEFEVALHEIADIGTPEEPGHLRSLLENLGVKVDWVPVPEAYRLIYWKGDERVEFEMPFGLNECVNAIERRVPGSAGPVHRFMELCREISRTTGYLQQTWERPDPLEIICRHSDFIKTCGYSVTQVMDALEVPKEAQDLLNAYWIYTGPPVDRTDFITYAVMLDYYINQQAWIPRNRSHETSVRLAERIRELGGEIRFSTRVDRILVTRGRVTGVRTEGGEVISCRHLISNVSPTLVYGGLIHPRKEVPAAGLRECVARVEGTACFVVYLGLNRSAEDLGLTAYSYFINKSMDTNAMYDSGRVREPTDAQASVCLNAAYPAASPEGTCMLSITALYTPEAWENLSPRDYFKEKNRVARGLIERFEQATGLEIFPHIEEVAVATPVTMNRYTSAHRGIVYGYEPEPWDSVVVRMMMMKREKHIRGLEFCGGFSPMGHGFIPSLTSGDIAAKQTLKSLSRGR